MHDKQVRRRRVVLGLLVAVSLILLTAYFGETANSPLHSVQRGFVEALSPVEKGASTVLAPVRSVASWVSSTLHAKSHANKLQAQVDQLNYELAQEKGAQLENRQLSNLVHLDNSIGVDSYRPVIAQVILRDPTLWYQTIEVDKGSDDGVALHDPVIGDKALVGLVTEVSPTASVVSLITDHTVSVTARVDDQNGDTGELVPEVGNPNELVLEYLQSPSPGNIQAGPQPSQMVVTAGFRSGSLDSYFPPNIPIGYVSNVNEDQLINAGQIQVAPYANLQHVDTVQILTATQSGSERAQVPSK